MSTFDYPTMSSQKSTDENVSAVRVWASDVTEKMNYYIDYLESRIESLENRIAQVEGEE